MIVCILILIGIRDDFTSLLLVLSIAESGYASNGNTLNNMEESLGEAKLQLGKEEEELEKTISGIAAQVDQVLQLLYIYAVCYSWVWSSFWTSAGFFLSQTKEIEDKIFQFEEFDLQMERKLQQFQQLQNLLFVDKLTILFHKNAAPKSGDNAAEPVKIDWFLNVISSNPCVVTF